MATRFQLNVAVLCAALAGCAGEHASKGGTSSGESEDQSLDMAASTQALEEDEDGGDEDAGDVTETDPDANQDCSLGGIRKRIKARFDTDGDGKLSDGERAAMRDEFGDHRHPGRHILRELRRAALIKLYDADGSGDLDADERAELKADLVERCENRKAYILSQYDENDDGKLEADEWQAFLAARKARIQARRAAILAEFDSNGDGKLGPLEKLAALKALKQKAEERRKKLEAEYDTNGDGKLDADEKASLVAYLKSRVRGEHFGEK